MHKYSDKDENQKKIPLSTTYSSTKFSGHSSPDEINNQSEVHNQRNLQEKANKSAVVSEISQLQSIADNFTNQNLPIQEKKNNTGLSDELKSGMENLSGFSMDDVKVHRNSNKPKELNAHAYAQGTEIHLGPGQEKHLPHEAWHVVQQKQGRVAPTKQLAAGVQINDNEVLEKEATLMGQEAISGTNTNIKAVQRQSILDNSNIISSSIQLLGDDAHIEDVDTSSVEAGAEIADFATATGLIATDKDKLFEAEKLAGSDQIKETGVIDPKNPESLNAEQQTFDDIDMVGKVFGVGMQAFKTAQKGAEAVESGDPVAYAETGLGFAGFVNSMAELSAAANNTPEIVGLIPGINDGLGLLSAGLALYKDNRAKKAMIKIKSNESIDESEQKMLDEFVTRINWKMVEDGAEVAWSIAQLVGLAFPGGNAGIAFIHKGANLLVSGAKLFRSYWTGSSKKSKAAKRLDVGQGGTGTSEGEKDRLETVEQMVKNAGGKHIDFVRLLRLQEEKSNLEVMEADETDQEAKNKIKEKRSLAQTAFEEKLGKYNSMFGAGGSVCDGKSIGENEVIMAKQFFLNMVKNMKDDVLKAANSRMKRFKHFISFHKLEKKIDHVKIFKDLYGNDGETTPKDIQILEAFENDPDGAYIDNKLQDALHRAKTFSVKDVSNDDLQKSIVDKLKTHTDLYDTFKGLDSKIFNDKDMKRGQEVIAAKFSAGMEKYFKKINPF